MPHPPINTVLFDLDGTIVDTEQAASQAIRSCFKHWGIAIDPADAGYITGRTWAAASSFLFTKYKIPVDVSQAHRELLDSYRTTLETNLPVVPGSADAVQKLSEHGHRLALVSGSYRAEILWALDKLKIRSHFKVILGAEDYPNSKPAPDGYLKALQMLGSEAHRAIVFEDSQAGISSGLAAGAWVVAITGTNHFGQDISHAHHHIPDLTGVDAAWVATLEPRLRALK